MLELLGEQQRSRGTRIVVGALHQRLVTLRLGLEHLADAFGFGFVLEQRGVGDALRFAAGLLGFGFGGDGDLRSSRPAERTTSAAVRRCSSALACARWISASASNCATWPRCDACADCTNNSAFDCAISALARFSPAMASASCASTKMRFSASAFFWPCTEVASFCATLICLSRLASASPMAASVSCCWM